jgi:hypothetical protein
LWHGFGILVRVSGFALLTGIGLATSAGLNAYIPLLMVGLLSRYTGFMDLPASWQWLENGWTITILGGLLLVEVVADKIPIVDHINDVLQTFVRPTAGGIAFGAAAGGTDPVVVGDPGQFFSSSDWVPIAIGTGIGLVVHAMKSTARVGLNAATVGVGAPVASTAEDAVSITLSAVAIIFPLLIILGVIGVIWLFVWVIRKRRRSKAAKAAAKAAPPTPARTR